MRAVFTYLTAIFLLSTGVSAFAQTEEWDAALDRYARICDQCIDLRQRSLAGEPVPMASITELLGELSALRNILQQAGGKMTPLQQSRFERIRQRYADAFDRPDQVPERILFLPGLEQRPGLPDVCFVPEKQTVLPDILPRKAVGASASRPGVSGGTKDFRIGLLVFGTLPVPAPGLMLRLDFGRAGVYAKGAFFPVSAAAYSCRSDGTTDRGLLWTSGRERTGMWAFTAGASYVLTGPLRLYAGAGFGQKTVLWEDVAGQWARVADLSPKGVAAEAGLLFDFGHFSLFSGVSTISFRSISLDLGVGMRF